jgi:hypothetical protein
MNRINILLTSLTTMFAVVSAVIKPTWALILTALFASATVAFALYQSGFNPVGKENQHRVAAEDLLWIREQLLLLITECHMPDADTKQLERLLEGIRREVTAVYKFAPNVFLAEVVWDLSLGHSRAASTAIFRFSKRGASSGRMPRKMPSALTGI